MTLSEKAAERLTAICYYGMIIPFIVLSIYTERCSDSSYLPRREFNQSMEIKEDKKLECELEEKVHNKPF